MDNINGPEKQHSFKYSLEALNYGEIIDRTIRIYRENFGFLISNMLKIYIPYIIVLVMVFGLMLSGYRMRDLANGLYRTSGFVFSLCTISLIIFITKMILELYKGQPLNADDIKEKCKGLYWKTFITSMYYGLAIAGFFILAGISSSIVMAFLGATLRLVGIILGITFFVVFFYLALKWAFSNSLAVFLPSMEGLSGTEALKRSQRLFTSNRESMFKVIFIPIIIQVLLFLIFFSSAFIPFVYMALTRQVMTMPMTMVFMLITTSLNLILSPLSIIAMTVVYFDIRIRTEGFDLEINTDRTNFEDSNTNDQLGESQ